MLRWTPARCTGSPLRVQILISVFPIFILFILSGRLWSPSSWPTAFAIKVNRPFIAAVHQSWNTTTSAWSKVCLAGPNHLGLCGLTFSFLLVNLLAPFYGSEGFDPTPDLLRICFIICCSFVSMRNNFFFKSTKTISTDFSCHVNIRMMSDHSSWFLFIFLFLSLV